MAIGIFDPKHIVLPRRPISPTGEYMDQSPRSDWTKTERGTHVRAVPPTPRTPSRVQLQPFAAPKEVAPPEQWTSPEAQQQALATYHRMQAVESVFAGNTPGQAVLGIPEYNQALRQERIDPKIIARASALLEEGRSGGNHDSSSIAQQVRNLTTSKEAEPEKWYLTPQQEMPTKSAYQQKLDASQDSISKWYEQTTANASRMVGRQVSAQEIRKFIPNLSHEQLEAITSGSNVTSTLAGPGAGKSTMMVAQFLDDVFNRGANPQSYQFLSKTHSAVNNMRDMLSGVENIIPNWKPQDRQFRTLDSAGLSLLTQRDENGTTALQRMRLGSFTPLYQGGGKAKNLEDIERAQQNATKEYLGKVMSRYGISTKTNDINSLDAYISQMKSQRQFGQSGVYEQSFGRGAEIFKGKEWRGDAALKGQMSPDLVLFLYEQSLKHQQGFQMPKQGAGKFDINDVAYLVQKAAQQGHIAPMQRFMGDEIQDASPSQVKMLSDLTGKGTRGFLAGDMGQMAVQRRWRIDQEIQRQFQNASHYTLTGNYRQGENNVGFLNSLNQLNIMQDVARSPQQVAMGKRDQAPTVTMGQDFPALYRQMVNDWLRLQGTSIETIKGKMASGQHPLEGLQYPAQRVPFAFQISREGKGRPVFRQVLQEMLGDQFMSQYYSEETPRAQNMNKLHAMTISQLRSRDVDQLFGDVTRGGKWDAIGYAQNLYTMLSRAKEQNHLYASMTNYPGSQYTLDPVMFGGQQVPPGFDALLAGMAQNAIGVQGLSPQELPMSLQDALSFDGGQTALGTGNYDLALTSRALEEMLFLNEHYQAQVGSDTGILEGKMDMGRTEDGRLLMNTSKMNAANIAGQYKRGGDPIKLDQALRSIRTLVAQGNTGDNQPVPTIEQFIAQMKSMAGPVDVTYEDVDFNGLRMAFDPESMFVASHVIDAHDNEHKDFGRGWDHRPLKGSQEFELARRGRRDSVWKRFSTDEASLRMSLLGLLEKPEAMAHPVVREMLSEKWTDGRMIKALTGMSKSLANTGKRPDMVRLNKYMMLGQAEKEEIDTWREELAQLEKSKDPLTAEQIKQQKKLQSKLRYIGAGGIDQAVQAVMNQAHPLNRHPAPLYNQWLQGVIEERSRYLLASGWIDGPIMEKLAVVAEEVADQIGESNPTNRQYFLDKAQKFRTYKSFDLDREGGSSLTRADIEAEKKRNPFQGAVLESMFGDQVKQHGVVKMGKEDSKAINTLLYHQGRTLRKINSPEKGQLLGVPYHISSLAPALTELRTYASSLEGGMEGNRGGIVDPMAVAALPLHPEAHETSLDKDFSFQQYGAGVGLTGYRKRLDEMLHPKSGVMQESHRQDLQRQLEAVQHIQSVVHDPQWQLRTAQMLRLITRATMGQDVMNKSREEDEHGNLGMDPIRVLFTNRKNDYREGMRTLESLNQFIGVLSAVSMHAERTGSIKRSQIAAMLSTFGYSYDDKQFSGLRLLEEKGFHPTQNNPDPSLPIRQIIGEYPQQQANLHGQLPRVPLMPGVRYRFMGGEQGFADLSRKQKEQGLLKAGMEGTLTSLGKNNFGLSKKLTIHHSVGTLPVNEYVQTAQLPGETSYSPIMQFQTEGGQSFPVIPDQLMMVPGQDLRGVLPWQSQAVPDVEGSLRTDSSGAYQEYLQNIYKNQPDLARLFSPLFKESHQGYLTSPLGKEEPAKGNALPPLSFPEQVQQRLLREAARTREQGFVMGYTSRDAREMSAVPFKKVLPLLTRPGGVKGVPIVTQKGAEAMQRGEFFSPEQAAQIRQEQIDRGQIIPPPQLPSPEQAQAAKVQHEQLEAIGHAWRTWLPRGKGLTSKGKSSDTSYQEYLSGLARQRSEASRKPMTRKGFNQAPATMSLEYPHQRREPSYYSQFWTNPQSNTKLPMPGGQQGLDAMQQLQLQAHQQASMAKSAMEHARETQERIEQARKEQQERRQAKFAGLSLEGGPQQDRQGKKKRDGGKQQKMSLADLAPTPIEPEPTPSRALVPAAPSAVVEPEMAPTPGVEPSAHPVHPSLGGAGIDALMGLNAMGPTMMAFGGMPPLPSSSFAGGQSGGMVATPVVEQATSPASPSLHEQRRASFDTLLPPSEVMDELMRDAPPSSQQEGGLSPFLMPEYPEKIPQPDLFPYTPPPPPPPLSRQQISQMLHGRVMGIQQEAEGPPPPTPEQKAGLYQFLSRDMGLHDEEIVEQIHQRNPALSREEIASHFGITPSWNEPIEGKFREDGEPLLLAAPRPRLSQKDLTTLEEPAQAPIIPASPHGAVPYPTEALPQLEQPLISPTRPALAPSPHVLSQLEQPLIAPTRPALAPSPHPLLTKLEQPPLAPSPPLRKMPLGSPLELAYDRARYPSPLFDPKKLTKPAPPQTEEEIRAYMKRQRIYSARKIPGLLQMLPHLSSPTMKYAGTATTQRQQTPTRLKPARGKRALPPPRPVPVRGSMQPAYFLQPHARNRASAWYPFQKGMSQAQKGVFDDPSQHILIQGGPGSGKSSTFVNKLAEMIHRQGVRPDKIVTISPMHSGEEALNKQYNERLRPTIPQRPGVGGLRNAQTMHAMAHDILFGGREEDEQTGQISFSNLQKLGMGHIQGILADVGEDELRRMSPESRRIKLREGTVPFLKEALSQHPIDRMPGQKRLGDLLTGIGNLKKGRTLAGSAYEDAMIEGRQHLSEGKVTQEAALAAYQQHMGKEGLIDFDDFPIIASQMLQQQGVNALPPHLQGLQVLGVDEAQDSTPAAMNFYEQVLKTTGGNPRLLVGMDPMQGLLEDLGAIAPGKVVGAYKDLFGRLGGSSAHHELNTNFRSDRAAVELNNAILKVATSKGEKGLSSQQVPAPTAQYGKREKIVLSNSDVSLNQRMFRSMLSKTGVDQQTIAANLQAGKSPFEGVDWSAGGLTKPSQIPGIFLTRGRRDFFRHIAGQTLQDDYNLSPQQASSAVKELMRNGIPGQKLLQSDAQKQATEAQFPIGTVGQFRGLQFEQPHVDVTRAGAWWNDNKLVSYLRNLFVGVSRVSEGGQNQLFASDRPFSPYQQKLYQRGAPFDESTPNQPGQGIVQLGTGRGSLITPSDATKFGKVGKQLVPNSIFEDILKARNAQAHQQPSPSTLTPSSGGMTLNLPPGGTVAIQGTNPQITVPNATISSGGPSPTPPTSTSPSPTSGTTGPLSFAGAPPAMIATIPTTPLAAVPTPPSPASPTSPPIASSSGGGGRSGGTSSGGGQRSSGGGSGGSGEKSASSYFNNLATTIGRTAARLGYEMQFVGKLFDQITTQAVEQGSEYRRGSMTFGGSGATGDNGFFDFTNGQSGISQMSATLPMFSKAQMANALKAQSSLTGSTRVQQQATTSILGLSALSGVDASSLMKDIGQATGTIGQGGNQQATQQLVGMLGNLYNGNLTDLNVTPTLSAINQVLPTLQGINLGGGSQLPDLMTIFKAALGSGMTSQNLGQVAQTVGSLAQVGTTPDLAGQQFLNTLFPGQTTANPQLMEYQKGQVEMSGQIQQMQLQQQQIPQQIAINNAEMAIQQANLKLSQQELGIQQQGLSLDKAELNIQQANLNIDKEALQLQGQDLALNQQSLNLSQQSLDLSNAQFQHEQQMQTAQYGPIGADVSREAYFSFMRNQQAAGYNPLSAETGTQFKSAPTAGLQNMEFYAGIEHQRQTAVLGRSSLMSDALFQENQKYLNQQEAFYEEENKLRNEDRAFQKDAQQKNLAIQQSQLNIQQSHLDISKQQLALSGQRLDLSQQSLDISKARLDLSKQTLDIQQKRLGLEEQRLTLDEQRNAMQNEQLQLQLKLLPEQIAAIQNLQTAMQQYAEGQGPINGKNIQPSDIIKQLGSIGDDAQLKQTIQQSRLPVDQQNTLYQLIKQMRSEGGFDKVQASTTKDDKALMDQLNKLVKGGAFTDQSATAAINDAFLNFGGKGDSWENFVKAFDDANKNWKDIATALSGLAPTMKNLATNLETWGPIIVGMGTLLNGIGLGQGLVGWLGKGGGAAQLGGAAVKVGSGVGNVAGKVGGGIGSFFGAGGGAEAILGSGVGSVAAPLALGAAALYGGWNVYNKDMYSDKTPLANRLGYGVLTSLLPGVSTGEQLHHDWDLLTDPKMRQSSGVQGVMDWFGGLFGGGGKPAVGAAGSANFSDPKPKYGMYMAEIDPKSVKLQQDSIAKQETWWQSMIGNVQKDWTSSIGGVGQGWNTMIGNSGKLWNTTIGNAGQLWNTSIEGISKQWNQTTGQIGQNWNTMIGNGGQLWNTSIDTIGKQWNQAIGDIGAGWNITIGNVGAWFNTTAGNIGQWWQDEGSNVGTAFSNAASGIGDAFQSWIIDPLYKFFTQTLPDTINNALANLRLPNLFGGGGSADFDNSGGAPGGFTTPHVNAQFGEQMNYGKHQGVDFNAAQGTPLHEFIGGAVTNTGFYDWGGEVDVNIGGGLTERYLHLSQISVHPGQKIGRGGFLGLTGGGTPASGLGYWSAGPHSHVQIDRGNINAGINPWPVWAAGGATNISQFYGGGTGGGGRGGAVGGPIPRSMMSSNVLPSPLMVSTGGGGSISAISTALNNLPRGGGGATLQQQQTSIVGQRANVVIQNLIGQAHFAITAGAGGTLSEQEQDKLMSQLLDILTDATKQLLGKL